MLNTNISDFISPEEQYDSAPGLGSSSNDTGSSKSPNGHTFKSSTVKIPKASKSAKRGNVLDIFVTSRVRRKIIVVFAKYPDFKTHVRGLAKLTKEDPGNIQRELNRMVAGDFLIVTKKGKTKIYQTNKQFPILKELQSIVIKSQKGGHTSKTIG